MNRRKFIRNATLSSAAIPFINNVAQGKVISAVKDINIGLIGLDTSHAIAFTKIINDKANPLAQGFKVANAYPYGSRTIESSSSRIPQYITEVKALGVEVVDSIEKVIGASDVIMLLTNDGKLHLEQILPVLKAKKPVFVDKPVAAHLDEVIKIYDAVKQYNVPMFSSSPLRYLEGAQRVRYKDAVGKVIGAEAYSPQKTEQSHTDLYWYGIHGVEILYTMMGPGCESVRRIIGTDQDVVVGKWKDGRIGTYKGDVQTRQYYGGTAYGTTGTLSVGPFAGYDALAAVILQFFKDLKSPVDTLETIELYTFMEAADVSKQQNGDWVNLQKVYDDTVRNSKK
ncbi:MAG: Gfo/Idh/MocA family oxidoreductase [Chryseolinea sp.]